MVLYLSLFRLVGTVMRKRWAHLVVDGDGANDHLLGVLSLHVVEPEGVDIGGQMATHLVRPDTKQMVIQPPYAHFQSYPVPII